MGETRLSGRASLTAGLGSWKGKFSGGEFLFCGSASTLDQALLDIESLFEEGRISPVEKTSLEDFYKKRTDVHPT
jgi:hypothetical protein